MFKSLPSVLALILLLASCRSAPVTDAPAAALPEPQQSVEISLGSPAPPVDGVALPGWLLPEATYE